MTKPFTLSLVLLAYNEEKNIRKAIESATRVGKSISDNSEVIVVLFDGSTDKTGPIVESMMKRQKGLRLVWQNRRGYGEAIRLGVENARYDFVFYTDADNQYDMKELSRLTPFMDRYDLAVGYRARRKDPFLRILTAIIFNVIVRTLFRIGSKDVDCSFKLFRRSIFKKIKIHSVTGLADAEILAKARIYSFKVKQVTITHFPRTEGIASFQSNAIPFPKPSVVMNLFWEMGILYREVRGIRRKLSD